MAGQGGHIDRRPGCIHRGYIGRERGVAEGIRFAQQIHGIGWVACQLHRRRANAAVADDDRGDALGQFRQHLWIAYYAGIVMGVDINEAGREHHSFSLRDLPAGVMGKLPDRTDNTGIDGHIAGLRFAAATVKHAHIPDKSVTTRHRAW